MALSDGNFLVHLPKVLAELPWCVTRLQRWSLPHVIPLMSLHHSDTLSGCGAFWLSASGRGEAPGGRGGHVAFARFLTPGALLCLGPGCDGLWVFSAVLTSACLSFRSPAAGAAVLHRPWRTRDESCWEPCGDGFAGPTQLTPWKHSLPTAPFLLQHATAPI